MHGSGECDVSVDASGFVYVGDVKVARVAGPGQLAFFDKNKARSSARGSNEVVVAVVDLSHVCQTSSGRAE